VALAALYLGYALAPTFLQDARGFSAGYIGFLFSLSAAGTLLFRSVVIRFPAGWSFAILLGLACLGMVLLWQMPGRVGAAAAFFLLGAISTTWVVMQASIGDAVAEETRGLALGSHRVSLLRRHCPGLLAGGAALRANGRRTSCR
jgi:hypothetical protein